MRTRRVFTVAVVTLGALGAPAAAIAAGWSEQTVPSPSSATNAYLYGVSCRSASACEAVGGSAAGLGGSPQPLAESWNGSKWSLQTPPVAAGTLPGPLHGVSCPSATTCEAVGGGPPPDPLLAYGYSPQSGWTLQSAPLPSAAAFGQFGGVSCVSASFCVAVGNFTPSSDFEALDLLAEVWNGMAWSAMTPLAVPDDRVQELTGVWCQSVRSCFAVGNADTATAATPLIERWTGTDWTIASTKVPAGQPYAALTAVTCRIGCVAVGDEGVAPYAERPSWPFTATALPYPTGGQMQAGESGVSCSYAQCVAVGSSENTTTAAPLAQIRSSGVWTLSEPVDPADVPQAYLDAVSCTVYGKCFAVGSCTTEPNTSDPLAESYTP